MTPRTMTVEVPLPTVPSTAGRWRVERCGSPSGWIAAWLAIAPDGETALWYATHAEALECADKRAHAARYDEQLTDSMSRWGIARAPGAAVATPPPIRARRRRRPNLGDGSLPAEPRRRRQWIRVTPALEASMRELRAQGLSQAKIAEQLGLSAGSVSRYLARRS